MQRIVTVLVSGLCVAGCRGSSGSSAQTDDKLERRVLIENLGTNIVVPRVKQFKEQSASLDEAVDAYCDAIDGDFTDLLSTAQQSWKDAMASWQYLEVMQFGPLSMNSNALRNDIYSWPLTNTCGVDREVVLSAESGYSLKEDDNRKGLDAIAYLLFDSDLDHACSESVTETASWNASSEADRRSARCRYLRLVADDLATQGVALHTAWDSSQDDYLSTFIDGSAYGSLRDTINGITDAFFYVDLYTKDRKLAIPAGISDRCTESSCPSLVELPYSQQSREAVLANVQALQQLFLGTYDGTDGEGFDDLLVELGAEELATSMADALTSAITNLTEREEGKTLATLATDLIPNDCSLTTVSDRRVEICAWHADVKKLTNLLKSEFLTTLDLEAPAQAEGDND